MLFLVIGGYPTESKLIATIVNNVNDSCRVCNLYLDTDCWVSPFELAQNRVKNKISRYYTGSNGEIVVDPKGKIIVR